MTIQSVEDPDAAMIDVKPRIQPAQITPLESRFKHCVHCYHTVDVWSRDGRFMLYSGFDDLNGASIVVRDTVTGDEEVIAQTSVVDYHTASGQRWALDDRAVLFKYVDADGVMYPALAFVDEPGEVQTLTELPGRCARQVVDHGTVAIMHSRARDGRPACIERVNLQTQEAEVLLTTDRAVAELPAELRDDGATWQFSHPVPNADGSIYLCKLMRQVQAGEDRGPFVAFFVFEPATSEVRCFGNRISGHPAWMADGRHILNIKSPRDGSDNRHLVLVDAKTGEDRRLIDLPIEGPGHPTPSPDGQFVVTDAFVPDGSQSPIYLIDLPQHQAFEIARLDHRFRGGVAYDAQRITRGQPHPVWAPCSTKLAVNFNHAGEHFGLMLIEGFLANE